MCILSDESARENLGQIDKIKQEVDSFCDDLNKFEEDSDISAINFCTTGELVVEEDTEEIVRTTRKAKKVKVEKQGNYDSEGKKLRPKKHFCDICNHAVESPSKLIR